MTGDVLTCQLAMKACPYRKDFYAKLGPSEEKVRPQLSEWLEALEKIVARMHQFYEYVYLPSAKLTFPVKAITLRAFSCSYAMN